MVDYIHIALTRGYLAAIREVDLHIFSVYKKKSYNEIARELNISPGTVRAKMRALGLRDPRKFYMEASEWVPANDRKGK